MLSMSVFKVICMNDSPFLNTFFCACVSDCLDNTILWLALDYHCMEFYFIIGLGIIIAYRNEVRKWILHAQIMVVCIYSRSFCSYALLFFIVFVGATILSFWHTVGWCVCLFSVYFFAVRPLRPFTKDFFGCGVMSSVDLFSLC